MIVVITHFVKEFLNSENWSTRSLILLRNSLRILDKFLVFVHFSSRENCLKIRNLSKFLKVFLNKMSDHDDHSLKDLISLKLRVTRNWTFFTSRDETSLNFRVLDFPKDRKYAQTEFRTSEWDVWRQKLRNRFSSHRTASIDLELFSAQYEISQKKVFGELENGADVSWVKKK